MPDHHDNDPRDNDEKRKPSVTPPGGGRHETPDPDRFMRRHGESWDAYKTKGVVRSAVDWRRKWARVMAPQGAARALVAGIVGVSVIAGVMWLRVSRRAPAPYSAELMRAEEVQRSGWTVIKIAAGPVARGADVETSIPRVAVPAAKHVILRLRLNPAANGPPPDHAVLRDHSGKAVWRAPLSGLSAGSGVLFVTLETRSFPEGEYVCAVECADGATIAEYRFAMDSNPSK